MPNLVVTPKAKKARWEEMQSGHLPYKPSSIVFTIPPEILEQIFEACVWGAPWHRLAFSQVCRRWRIIALNCHALWQWINIAKSELAIRELLLRSRASDLHIFARFPSSLSRLSAEELGRHARRIKSINIEFGQDYAPALEMLFHHIEADLINLTRLSLYSVNLKRGAQQKFLDLLPTTPLKRLELRSVTVPTNGFGRNLRFLSLKDIESGYCSSTGDLYVMFQSVPHLEHLSLRRLSIPQSPNPSLPLPVALTSLRELFLEGQRLIRTILPLISYPLSTRVQLDFPDLEVVRFFQYRPPSQESCILLFQNDSIKLRPMKRHPPPLRESYRADILNTERMTFLSDLHILIDTSRFTTLDLGHNIYHFVSPRGVAEFLAPLTNLETLRIACDMALDPMQILSAMLAKPTSSSSSSLSGRHTKGDHGPPICPRVQTVSFYKTFCGPGSWVDVSSPAPEWLESLVPLVQARKRASIPISVLEFPFWVPVRMVVRLREYGAVVRVGESA